MMARTASTTGRGAGNWRRKWKRSALASRREAAASLGDIFRRRRGRGGAILAVLLLAAAGLHAGLLPFFETGQAKDILHLVGKDSYIRKVVQTERAKQVSRGLASRITMPPPPPVPEAVVNTTLSAELTTDIHRVIGGTLDVKITSRLAKEVAASLREELAAASKQIADGKLSAEQIKQMQEQFKRRAHRKAVSALRQYREETQIEHARLSVKEWYEERVSRTLRSRITYGLFTGRHGRVWPGHWNRYGWDGLRADLYPRKVGQLGSLAQARHANQAMGGRPIGHGWRLLPDWPTATTTQARCILGGLEAVKERHSRGWQGSWAEGLAEYVQAYYPHRRKFTEQWRKKLDDLWAKAFAQARAYEAQGEAGADQKQLQAARKAALQAIKALHGEASKLIVDNRRRGEFSAVNRAVRSRVLRGPQREKMYAHFVDLLLAALGPAVRDMAENEFEEGIIIRQKGVDKLTKQFAADILAGLRRDIEKTVGKAKFDEIIFHGGRNPYKSKVTGQSCAPDKADIERDEKALQAILARWPAEPKAYPQARAEIIARHFRAAVERVVKELLARLLEEGRMRRDFYASVESVDYTDKVAQRLHARARALAGRGQDLARLTEEGVPDTSAPMIALMFGAAKGHGASLEPTLAGMVPGYHSGARPEVALRGGRPRLPPTPYPWARVTQPEVKPDFRSPCWEGIPFLANFPRLDGDLRDWGKIRPLLLRKARKRYPGPEEPILLYAAWNYQGFFFGYHMPEPAYRFAYPRMYHRQKDVTGIIIEHTSVTGWAYTSDYFRMMFDTLDARGETRGEPHTQEFVIFPRGTEHNPNVPGIERVVKSTRDAVLRGPWGGHVVSSAKVYLPQPGPDEGPDGTGPYRVTKFAKDGYTVEAFLPRSLFKMPVFAPGWWIGFDCVVAFGAQPRGWGPDLHGKIWCPIYRRRGRMRKDVPLQWGDLLLLGTDPRLAVQNADAQASLTTAVVPGHSYLVTVIDPDRNVHVTAEDTLVVSAEVISGTGLEPVPPAANTDDVEVYILKETGKNTSVFRGYVDTQPGRGRQVQGVLELMPGQELRLGYVDLANAEGRRNVIYRLNLPVVAGLTTLLAAGP